MTPPPWARRHNTSQETTWRPPRPGMSRFRCFCYYLNPPYVLHGPLRHLPLPGVSRFRQISYYLSNLVCAPARGTFAGAWNTAVRTRGVFTHRTGFQKLACAERGLVRTARERWQAWSQATGAGTGGGSWRGRRRRKTQAGTGRKGTTTQGKACCHRREAVSK